MVIKTLIVDDHKLIRDGISSILLQDAKESISIVGSCSSGNEAISFLKENKVDVILMDINMPELDGIETTKILLKKHPSSKIIMLTMYSEFKYIKNASEAGAMGYVLKETGKVELLFAIKQVASGKRFYCSEVVDSILTELKSIDANKTKYPGLSDREIEVMNFLTKGYAKSVISKKLMISPNTIDVHRRNILNKLNLKSILDLVRYKMEIDQEK